jgi:hypothetical protein
MVSCPEGMAPDKTPLGSSSSTASIEPGHKCKSLQQAWCAPHQAATAYRASMSLQYSKASGQQPTPNKHKQLHFAGHSCSSCKPHALAVHFAVTHGPRVTWGGACLWAFNTTLPHPADVVLGALRGPSPTGPLAAAAASEGFLPGGTCGRRGGTSSQRHLWATCVGEGVSA